MSFKVHLYSSLQNYTGNRNIVEVEGNTVGKCLDSLTGHFPDLKPMLFDPKGKLLPTIYISVNLNSPKSEPVSRVLTENDELYIILIVAGG